MANPKKQLDRARESANSTTEENEEFVEIDAMVAGLLDDLSALLNDFGRRWFGVGGFLACAHCRGNARKEKRRRKGEKDYLPPQDEPAPHGH